MPGRFFLAALCLFPLTGLASAGPIEWSYTAHIRTTTGRGTLDLGTHRLASDPSGNGTGDPEFADYAVTAPLGERTLSGTYPAHEGQSNDPIPLLSVGYGYSVDPVADAPPSGPGFLVTFTLTDLASGETGTVEFRGRSGVATTGQYPTWVLFSASMTPDETELRLGWNRYRITAVDGWPDEIEEPAVARVLVEATAATPEPGTIALAGLGLAAVGLRRLRRRTV